MPDLYQRILCPGCSGRKQVDDPPWGIQDCQECFGQGHIYRVTPSPSSAHPNGATIADYEKVLADHRRLVRELDVLLNGEEGAAQQASLGDIVAQVRKEGTQVLDRHAHRRLALGCAAERACEELPEGWELSIILERGAGTLRLTDADGNDIDPEERDDFNDEINCAIDAAIAAGATK